MTMATYDVRLYYHGCYSTTVEANTPEQALEKAEDEVSSMTDLDFFLAIDVMQDDCDVSRIATH